MSNQEGAALPDPEDPFFGNEEVNLTPWLIEWVRVRCAEHHSTIYDDIPLEAFPILVKLTLNGMTAAEEAAENDPEEPFA